MHKNWENKLKISKYNMWSFPRKLLMKCSPRTPLMFSIHVNDFPNVTQCHTTLFADDITIHLSNKNLNDLQQEMNKELNKTDFWMKFG